MTSRSGPRPDELPQAWRSMAQVFRDHADERLARAYDLCADALEAALARGAQELLNLQEAAELSGYSPDHLGRLVREGKIPNRGRPGAPRVALGDLPTKPGQPVQSLARQRDKRQLSPTQIVRSTIIKGVG